jgi:hypothetical protein
MLVNYPVVEKGYGGVPSLLCSNSNSKYCSLGNSCSHNIPCGVQAFLGQPVQGHKVGFYGDLPHAFHIDPWW